MSRIKSPLFWLLLSLGLIAVLAFFGPEEKTLGPSVRIVYLHGAWVLAAEAAIAAAALLGLIGLILRRPAFHLGSAALGRAGIVFWLTYLPLSLWAMQANWNGLFLAEPRFRLALTFAVVGLLLQIGLWIVGLPWLTSLSNILFAVTLRVSFSSAVYVMHPPPSPIFNSGNAAIIGFFVGLCTLVMMAVFSLAGWFYQIEKKRPTR